MRKLSTAVAVGCCFTISAASCKQTPPPAQTGKLCPPLIELASIKPLACLVYGNHLLGVGNASKDAIPKGTPITFAAKLVNAGAYCATVPAPEPIPPHLFVVITGQPLFDDQAPCQAWQEVPPVVNTQ
jgi:hypothetical protein